MSHFGCRRFLMGLLSLVMPVLSGYVFGMGSDCLNAPALPSPTGTVVEVSNNSELQAAVNNLDEGITILLAPGQYNLTRTLFIRTRNITLRGASDRCDEVVLSGRGMENADYANVPSIVWSDAVGLKIYNMTLAEPYFHSVQLQAEADDFHLYNVKMLNAGEQFVKGSAEGFGNGPQNGVVEYSIMEYTDAPPNTDHGGGGTGYTNGVDVHGAKNWVIRNNLFKNFHTPDSADRLWNPAILMWNGSEGTLSEGNVFINVDRAISYGLTNRDEDHRGGIIRNNMVYYSSGLYSTFRRLNSDAAIIVWDSPQTKVYHNTVLTNGNLNLAIELRYDSVDVEVKNNLMDKGIRHRNSLSYEAENNVTTALASWFVDPVSGNLRLKTHQASVVDQASLLEDARTDIDGRVRSVGLGADIGAHEFTTGSVSPPSPPENVSVAPR